MWFLLFTCSLTAGGVPTNSTREASPAPPGNVSALDPPRPANTTSEVPLHEASNATAHVPGAVSSGFDPLLQASGETLEDLLEETAVEEGDILIVEDRNAVGGVWTGGVVPYIVSDKLKHRESNIRAAFKMISDVTCIRFRKRTTERSYIVILKGRGCASYVGRQGGGQPLYYSQRCTVGNLCHELVHALGLHHEHTRQDRDRHISVQWHSIVPGKQRNFKMKSGNTLNLPYDTGSIMHYGKYFFSANGYPTLVAKDGSQQMGQRSRLSKLDIQRLNTLYRCGERG